MSLQVRAAEHAYTGVVALLELFNGSVEAVCALLQVAADSIEVDMRRIEAGFAASDAMAVADAAHRLKGTSGSVFAQRLVDIGSSIERDARTGSLPGVAALLPELQAAVDSLAAAIGSYARGGACSALVQQAS